MMNLIVSGLILSQAFTFAKAEYPQRAPLNVDFSTMQGCTSIVVSPEASIDGAMTTHTNDCKQCDSRLSKVPAMDHPQGSMKAIYKWRAHYPRFVGNERGATYKLSNTDTQYYPWTEDQPIGYIPQVSHTYAYVDGLYGIMNEHQVGIGESTCAARTVSVPVFAGGSALLDISALSRLGLERGTTAREVITIMGELAEQYGFYGAEWTGFLAEGEAGEVLSVADPKEAFTFHILGDSTGKSAVWAAQKIPAGHISVCANAFYIKEIDFNDHENFLYSKNILTDAQKLNYWQPEYGPFHFTKTYGLVTTFEAYSSRRSWRIFNIANPDLKFDPDSSIEALPFSIPVNRKLNHTDIIWMQRDHYEGTQFDLTKGLQSGPYGNPNRYDPSGYLNVSYGVLLQGRFERSISLYRTIYSQVTVSRPNVPNQLAMMWFGSAIPHGTYYQPVYIRSSVLPSSLTVGSLHGYRLDSAYWVVTAISGWMEKMYSYTQQDVGAAQIDLESREALAVEAMEKQAIELISKQKARQAAENVLIDSETTDDPDVIQLITDFNLKNSEAAHKRWVTLHDDLITKYHDGFRVDNVHVADLTPISIFYPLWWLQAVGYFAGPPANGHPDLTKTAWQFVVHPPSLPPHSSAPQGQPQSLLESSQSNQLLSTESGWSSFSVFFIFLIGVISSSFITYVVALKQSRRNYMPIQQHEIL